MKWGKAEVCRVLHWEMEETISQLFHCVLQARGMERNYLAATLKHEKRWCFIECIIKLWITQHNGMQDVNLH